MHQIWRHDRVRSELRCGAEIAALTGFAIVQPVLDVMGRAPDFFLFRDADARDIAFMTAALIVVPVVGLWGLGLASGVFGSRVRVVVHRATIALLLAIVVTHALKTATGLRGVVLLLVGVSGAALLSWLYIRRTDVSQWIRYASPAPLVFALLFLFTSPAAVLVTGGDTAEALAGVEARAPVVMVVFDEFPLLHLLDGEGEVDERLYPNFARLASDGTWFRNATSVSGQTPIAVPTLLTGRFPPPDATAPHVAYYPENLFTLLGGAYDVNAHEIVTKLCPSNVCEAGVADAGRGGGFRALLGDSVRTWRSVIGLRDSERDPAGDVGVAVDESPDDDAPAREDAKFGFDFDAVPKAPVALEEFRESVGGTERSFHFVHMLLPHVPWEFLPSGDRYPALRITRAAGPKQHEERWPHTLDRHRAVLQTVYTDAVLGQMLDHLDDVGLYDRALVVVTADHGLSHVAGEGQAWKTVNDHNAHHVAWVPLFVKMPGQEAGQIRDDNALLVDVVPTVADALGVEVPWELDGLSLLDDVRDSDTKPFWNNIGDAEPVQIDATDWFPEIRAGFTDEFLEPGDEEFGLYRVGPFADLVGTRPDEHGRAPPGEVRVTVERPEMFERVEAGKKLPAIVSGFVERGDVESGEGIAVVINGVIGGVSEVFPLGEHDQYFATMIPPSLLQEGENRIGVYRVERRDDGFALSQVTQL